MKTKKKAPIVVYLTIKQHKNGSYYMLIPKNFIDFGQINPGRKKVTIEDLFEDLPGDEE